MLMVNHLRTYIVYLLTHRNISAGREAAQESPFREFPDERRAEHWCEALVRLQIASLGGGNEG